MSDWSLNPNLPTRAAASPRRSTVPAAPPPTPAPALPAAPSTAARIETLNNTGRPPAEWLPSRGRSRWIALDERARSLNAQHEGLRPRIDHAREALARARQHYAEVLATPTQGPALRVHHLHGNSRLPSGEVPLPSFVPAGEERDRWLAHAAGEMGAAEAELNRLLELERELASISRALAELHRNIRSWLAEAAKLPRNLVQAGPSKMEVPAGDLPTVVEALRSELAAIQEQLAAVAAAPYPASDAKCAAAGLVDRLAAAGAPDCARAV